VVKLSQKKMVDKTCLDMRTQAIEDIKAGKYKLFEFGIVSSPDTNVLILKQLKIELISGGCVVTDGIDCYSAIMDSAIRKKYPNEIIENYNDGFNRIRFKEEFFTQTNSTVLTENTKIITKQLSTIVGLTIGKIVIELFINKQGKAVKIRILKGINRKIDLILIEKLQKETFRTMTIGKLRVNSILIVPIKINK
jgi:hypothetical protein